MQQVQQYAAGERDYALIKGDTGPLVYPGMHVYIYRLLYLLTDRGRDIRTAQVLFVGVYLAAVWVVMLCYRKAKVSWFILLLQFSVKESKSWEYDADDQLHLSSSR